MPSPLTLHMRSRGVRCARRHSLGAPVPTPTRRSDAEVAFVGQSAYFQACALADECPEIAIDFVDFLRAPTCPDGAFVAGPSIPMSSSRSGPRIVPSGGVRCPRARSDGRVPDGAAAVARGPGPSGRDRRLADLESDRCGQLRPAGLVRAADSPAADDVCAGLAVAARSRSRTPSTPPVRPARADPGVLFVGRPTSHRERYLSRGKQQFDLFHAAHGVEALSSGRSLAQTRRRNQPPQRAPIRRSSTGLPAPRGLVSS